MKEPIKVWVEAEKGKWPTMHLTKPERIGNVWYSSIFTSIQLHKDIMSKSTVEDEPVCFELQPVGLVSRQAKIIKELRGKLHAAKELMINAGVK